MRPPIVVTVETVRIIKFEEEVDFKMKYYRRATGECELRRREEKMTTTKIRVFFLKPQNQLKVFNLA